MRSIKGRIEALERVRDPGFILVFGTDDEDPDEAIKRYCLEHGLDRERHALIFMDETEQNF